MSEVTFSTRSLFGDPTGTLALWRQHWEETEVAYRKAPLAPDLAQFRWLEESGKSLYYCMHQGSALVGHLYFILHSSRHTSTSTASEDFFFITPEARQGFNAMRLIRYAVADLQARGIADIGMSSKLTGGRDIAPLLRRAGFRHVANFYVFRR